MACSLFLRSPKQNRPDPQKEFSPASAAERFGRLARLDALRVGHQVMPLPQLLALEGRDGIMSCVWGDVQAIRSHERLH